MTQETTTVPPPLPIVGEDARALFGRLVEEGHQPEVGDQAATQELLRLGLIRDDVSIGYVPVDPRYVGARLEAAWHTEAARSLAHAAAVSGVMRDLRDIYSIRGAAAAGLIEFLRGSDSINSRLSQVLEGCTTELLVCQPGGERRQEILDETYERDIATLRRCVEVRTIYHKRARLGSAMHQWVASMTAAGAEIRTLSEQFERMIIIDRRIAVIPGDTILTTSNEAVAYVVNDAGVAEFLARIFQRDWARAQPWDGTLPQSPLTDRQQAILELLATGANHQQIGRVLDLGRRTLAEAIAELKVYFDVTTLFALACAWKDCQLRAQNAILADE